MFKKIYKGLKTLLSIETVLVKELKKNNSITFFQQRNIDSSERIVDESASYTRPIIVSLTTYSKRIEDVYLTIESLGFQTQKANKVILWLDESEFSVESLPGSLKRLVERGLEIKFCPNYKSYKKIIPSLRAFPNCHIITADDDILYPAYLVEKLYQAHLRERTVLVGHRAHKITKSRKGKLNKYINWEYETTDSDVSDHIFLTTGGGTLFPANIFPKELIEDQDFLALCPSADDIWIKVLCLRAGIKCKNIDNSNKFKEDFTIIENNQDIGLFKLNVVESANDKQLLNCFNRYTIEL